MGQSESMGVGESLSGAVDTDAIAGPELGFEVLAAWVCNPCGKLLGLATGAKPKCCGTEEHVVKVDAKTIKLDKKTQRVVAASHL